jgi:hypothetical protein
MSAQTVAGSSLGSPVQPQATTACSQSSHHSPLGAATYIPTAPLQACHMSHAARLMLRPEDVRLQDSVRLVRVVPGTHDVAPPPTTKREKRMQLEVAWHCP